jgi:tetratricopeptide (TPR) repeat protein
VLRGFAIFFLFVALVAVAVELPLRSRRRAHERQMEMAAERALLDGGLRGLLQARALTLSGAAVAHDPEAAATLALASAMLASEYGLPQAAAALVAADIIEATPRPSPRAQALKLASRALVEVTNGRPEPAAAWARQSVALGHKQASPLFALGRVRFRQGDPDAAAHAFQAALVREPKFVEAKVAWAEAGLELGERARARDALQAALAQTPDHVRALLLLAEAEPSSAKPGVSSAPWEAACARDEAKSPFVASACALRRAHASIDGRDWNAAARLAEAAGSFHPPEPRTCAAAAQLLASLGAVDRAASCLDKAAGVAGPALPSLRWARLAVELGRGQLALPPTLPLASSPWAPLLMARIALATGGVKALSSAAARPGDAAAPTAPEKDDASGTPGDEFAVLPPALAYLQGMQARLAGNPSLAAELLAKALQGHGDACRAAGEYLEVCRVLGRVPDADALAWLARENAHCVNLPAVAAAAAEKRARKRPGRAQPELR